MRGTTGESMKVFIFKLNNWIIFMLGWLESRVFPYFWVQGLDSVPLGGSTKCTQLSELDMFQSGLFHEISAITEW